MLGIYFDEYNVLLDAKRSKMSVKYDPANLTLDEYDYDERYNENSSDGEELDDLPLLEGDEKKEKY